MSADGDRPYAVFVWSTARSGVSVQRTIDWRCRLRKDGKEVCHTRPEEAWSAVVLQARRWATQMIGVNVTFVTSFEGPDRGASPQAWQCGHGPWLRNMKTTRQEEAD
jgi:hypothetical protein